MKVIMFGWEFPPHISGGLGTACYGLTKALATFDEMQLTLVVPKAYGDEKTPSVTLIGADHVPVFRSYPGSSGLNLPTKVIEINTPIIPYTNADEYFQLIEQTTSDRCLDQSDEPNRIPFSGNYGSNLFQEIDRLGLVAEVLVRENEFDVIYAHDWMTFPAGMAAKEKSGKPLVVHVHSTEFDRGAGWVNQQVFEIEKKGMEAADKVIAVSNLTRRIILEKYQLPPEKVVVVYNAVEPAAPFKKPLQKNPGTEKVVSFLGRITVQKGPGYFVEAASLVLGKMKNVRFVMAGKGDMAELMARRVAELGIADRFQFPGFLSEEGISDLFLNSDILAMPSVSEPFGIVALEAMQAGVPVVLSRQSGASEVIQHALKVNYWDVGAQADAICSLLNDTVLRTEMSKNGKREAKKFQWKISAKEVMKVFSEVMNDLKKL
jgi:glycosyltransferase involved in cell wall biosynthesis